MRRTAKANKDWATSDLICNRLAEIGFDVKDTKDGFEWKGRTLGTEDTNKDENGKDN